ncbi:TetR/AcrR family transcriptional regulator [Latilactobacillus curvatus]|uniref:TetR/AcrR family transcriptional regulator n=1 Tax=Latilactobacillus curvatus TaxID=28038 RepID=UPI0024115957|nr:TetR/AcrR family transcriptional regulator [Latilactobacillus curvatus]MDG2979288.1 TetR/AcrR family transcriptional regulator [Latilactobacillus curvatus]
MRKIDEQKKRSIELAILAITKEQGIQGLSFGKIAKRAQVSSGAPYVYFEDKTDMLSRIYLQCKILFDVSLRQDIDKGKSMKERIFLSVSHFAQMYLDYPLEANFITEIRANPKLISPEAKAKGNALASPLTDLYEEAVAKDCLVTTNLEFITMQLFAPFIMLIMERSAEDQTVSIKELNEIIEISVNSILK